VDAAAMEAVAEDTAITDAGRVGVPNSLLNNELDEGGVALLLPSRGCRHARIQYAPASP
jgi:hypothetical protein